MKLVKSLLLGSAAGLSAVAVAQAADLPVRKAAPVEYVRVCSAYGAGFFYIPGTDTCLRVGGRVRAEYEYHSHRAIGSDQGGFRGLGRLNLDARTQTPYGTLRAFVRFEIAKRSGNGILRSGTQERLGNAIPGLGIDEFGRLQTNVNVDKAFIQFAGFTAGRAASFFDFYAHDLDITSDSYGSDTSATQLFAYTATFGGGWSATISVEDAQERRSPLYNTGLINNVQTLSFTGTGALGFAAAGGTTVGVSPLGVTFDPVTGIPTSSVNLDVVQRSKMPDVVGVLRVDQAWGSAQLSGAVHELALGPINNSGLVLGPTLAGGAVFAGIPAGTVLPGGAAPVGALAVGAALPNATFGVRRPDTEYGFAVQGGLKVNLPMIAAGDVLWLQAAYADGALSYAGIPSGYLGGEQVATPLTNKFNQFINDATVDAFGRVRKTEAATFVGAFLHYWTPEWRSAFVGSYARVDFDSSLRSQFGPAGLAPFQFNAAIPATFTAANNPTTASLSPLFRDYDSYTGSVNLIWSPVKDLDIGVEAFYIHTQTSSGRIADPNKPNSFAAFIPATGVIVPVGTAGSTLLPRTTNFDDLFLGRFRIQRDF